ncbi:TetR/AcrR family transcriptional regulator [Rhodococcus erythropolis]|uniref:TetR/AcrR family transcriptional regulator n=1 Tax=Rhodococcus erythropolis TaxID=1833 RepID=UPI001E2CAD09|nr:MULTISPECIES: TetR/AcrR family transcriptional regulator [Rhodococcus erythropolis group]MCD2109410.1 TetR/AcrR family transcriptional regulator [Rhodococcus qingshengii]MCZ4527401.1 TetR/AcrR family transcriptional regulator [Rhodococcus erythropolis]
MAPNGITKRRRETLARLLDAAEEVFAERGFGAPSIEDICAAAGYTRGAFYSNFASKDELFFALFARQSKQMQERLAVAVESATSRTDPIAVITEVMAQHDVWQGKWFLLTTEFTLYAVRNRAAGAQLARRDAELRETLASLMSALLERSGWVAAIPIEDVARVLMALSDGLSSQSLTETGACGGELERRVVPAALVGLVRPDAVHFD